MNKAPSKQRINWHVLILAKILIIVGIFSVITTVILIGRQNNDFYLYANLIPSEGTIGMIKINNPSEINQEIIQSIINDHDFNILLENVKYLNPVIAITQDGWVIGFKNENKFPSEIPASWEVVNNKSFTMISNAKYSKPINSIAKDRKFQKTINNINIKNDLIFYINTEELVKNFPRLYFGWKKFLPESVLALGGSSTIENNSIKINSFIEINKDILPESPFRQSDFFEGSIMKYKTQDEDLMIAGTQIDNIFKKIITGLEKTNLPLAIELKKGVKKLQKKLFINDVSTEKILSFFSDEFLIQYNETGETFSFATKQEKAPIQNILSAIQKESKFLSPQKKYFKLPDFSSGAERIARKAAPVLESEFNGMNLLTLDLKGVNWNPTFVQTEDITLITSSFDKTKQVLEQKEVNNNLNKFDKTYSIIFSLNPNSFRAESSPLIASLQKITKKIEGGAKFFDDGIIVDITLEQ